jgi:hypothetical protein
VLSATATSLRDRVRGHWGWLAVMLVVLGALVLLLYPYGSGSDDKRGAAAASVATLRGAYLTPDASFSSDPLLQGRTTPLVVVTPSRSGRTAAARVLAGGRSTVSQQVALPDSVRDAALTRWADDEPAIASLRRRAATLQVTAASLDSGRRLADERVRIPLLGGRAAVARLSPWTGVASDLFVIAWPRPGSGGVADRAAGVRPLARLLVLDGDARFRRVELSQALPLTTRTPAEWQLLVARVSGGVPDLVLVRRPARAHAEVHVLSGESQFHQFILHQQLDLPSDVAGRARFVAALDDGRPVLRAIEPRTGRATVRTFALGSAAPGA